MSDPYFTTAIPPIRKSGELRCGDRKDHAICSAAQGHAGNHVAYFFGSPDQNWPQAASPRVVCLTDCRPGGEHLPACPMYLPALVKTHPAVAELRDALAAYAGLMNSSPHGRDWGEMWAGNHGRLAAAAEQARVLLDRIAGGTA